METQNITLSLPKSLVKRAKVVAAKRETSVSALLAGQLEELVDDDDARESAMHRFMARVGKGWDLGTNGKITTTREELHDRRL